MRWSGRRESGNVEDRRGMSGGTLVGGGIGGIVIAIIIYFLGGDPSQVINTQQSSTQQTPEKQAAEDQAASFVKVVLADTEDVWNKIFSESGKQYAEPKLVLFTGTVQSACGGAQVSIRTVLLPV
ncbi:neutral zinc metallopeptidase [Chitinophaga sedimenti]|uniref:neutral zinc metallopeptidase n=1 Tax=Chitinophaga sedimenti TaxID=2033606 RepID=UPI00249EEEC0|nr:neutral zinc metallopeptidase [Chitinophaga sedimenti]